MPIAVLLVILMVGGAVFTKLLVFIPLGLLDLLQIPTWLLLTIIVVFLSWFLAE